MASVSFEYFPARNKKGQHALEGFCCYINHTFWLAYPQTSETLLPDETENNLKTVECWICQDS